MFENIDFTKMASVLEDVQKKAQEMQKESEAKTYIAKSGGGMVKVSANGNSEIIDMEIDDSLLEDKESMQILLISAINDVLKMAEDDKKSQMTNIFGNLGDLSSLKGN